MDISADNARAARMDRYHDVPPNPSGANKLNEGVPSKLAANPQSPIEAMIKQVLNMQEYSAEKASHVNEVADRVLGYHEMVVFEETRTEIEDPNGSIDQLRQLIGVLEINVRNLAKAAERFGELM